MGNCFSRSKGRPPPAPNDKENINWEMCSAEALTQNNGNSQVLQRERSVRSFYPRIANMGRVGSESKLGSGSMAKGTGGMSESKASSLFEVYRDSSGGDEDTIAADGIERLCADLCLSPDEFRVLLLAWKLNAGQMCRFTRDEFLSGCRSMHVDSLRGIQARLPEIANEVASDADLFKDLYRFTFRFGLDPGTGQRILPADMAVVLWRLVFTVREPPVLVRWLRFLECHPHVRGIPRDTWNMFLNFAESVGDDLSAYDDAEAWPSIFDDFVEFENDQANQNITTKDRDKGIIETERG